MSWKPLIIGAVVGAAVGWFLASGKGGNTNITGSFARPFQFKTDSGEGRLGG